MSDLFPFLGRFHVLILHLPIGLLAFAVLQELWFALRPKIGRPPLADGLWLTGLLSAILACGLGYLLATSGDYDPVAVAPHLWWGLAVAAVALVAWVCFAPLRRRGLGWALILGSTQSLVLVLAGHHGGNLTHGPDFLVEKAPPAIRRAMSLPPAPIVAARPPPATTDSAELFADYIHPILEQNCVTCHRPGKKKGGLRLDTLEQLMLGGDTELAVVARRPDESELIRRVMLPHDHDEFMPGGGKKPLTSDEVALLRWWIETGASPTARIAELKPDPVISSILARMQIAPASPGPAHSDSVDSHGNAVLPKDVFPLPPVAAAPPAILARLESLGFDVKRVSQEIAYLDIDYYPLNREPIPAATLQALREVGPHVVWLNLAASGVTDEQLQILAELPNLMRLDLTGNPVTVDGLERLPAFAWLTSLNLTRTQVDDRVWPFLDRLPGLQRAYLWGTPTSPPGPRPYLPQ